MHETATKYTLEGEFPGLGDKSKLDIQFTNYKMLLIRGTLERPCVISTPQEAPAPAPAPASLRSLNPTVEDTDDESDTASTTTSDDFEIILTPLSEKTRTDSPRAVSLVPVPAEQREQPIFEDKKPAIRPRVQVAERSFSFPGPIDIGSVSASLERGLLRIVVPKGTRV